MSEHLLGQSCDCLGVGDVELMTRYGYAGLTRRCDNAGQGFGIVVDQGQMATARRKTMSERGAYTLAGPGNNRNAIAERETYHGRSCGWKTGRRVT
jgi:hypothetical protein